MNKIYKTNSKYYNSFLKKKVDTLLNRYNIVLPKEYEEFIFKYKVGRNLEKWDAFLDHFFRPTPIYKIKVETNYGVLSYNWLNSVDQILYDLEFYPNALEILESMKLLRIGDLVDTGGLFLGVAKENQGMVYKYLYDIDETPKLLFTSFFEFINSIKLEVKNEFRNIKVSSNKRYFKNDSISFKKSQLLDSIETSKYENINLFDPEILLNSLNGEIDEIRS